MPGNKLGTIPPPPATDQKKRLLTWKRLAIIAFILAFAWAAVALLSRAGSFLTIDNPQRSNVIVVLEGAADGSRYQHAIKLQKEGYAPGILLDADVSRQVYGKTEADMAMDFLRRNQQSSVQICATVADSTYAEAVDVQRCLQRLGATSALIVTANFHTRRALSIFQKRLPQYRWSIAAASWPYHSADQYWRHRAWAKSVLDEVEKFFWWKLVDQWSSGVVLPSANN